MSLAKDKSSLRAAMNSTLQLSDWIGRLETRERAGGLAAAPARARVARRLEVAPGTLENLRKGRAKRAVAGLFERARRAVEAALLSEAKALEHEIILVRSCGVDGDDHAVREAAASLAHARAILSEARKS